MTTPAAAAALEAQHRNRPGAKRSADDEITELKRQVADLQDRVWQLEHTARSRSAAAPAKASRGRSRG